jgi:hypothetical protein
MNGAQQSRRGSKQWFDIVPPVSTDRRWPNAT